jgi:4-amino-4-deoxy-L-arabinose transferase-like glycosyltransferase
MFPFLHHRYGHYALLLFIGAALSFPNLGAPSLWDIDEGNNSEAAREMMESGNWVIPTFNYELRVDKPALLYWLQIGAYRVFGASEFAARLPSALAALLTILLTYELARSLFGMTTGLLAGVVLASVAGFCASAHFANPDALLNVFTVLTLFFFWQSFVRERGGWFVLSGVSAGLGVLAKGPVGLVLPAAVSCLFLLSCGRLRSLRNPSVLWAALAFVVVALPWYILVATDTKAEFLRGFILKHNVGRFLSPMENHRGPVYYYLGVLIVGFAPWSALLGLAAWAGLGARARSDDQSMTAYRFLWAWVAVYLVFFSVASTKLPNYILPIYAPLAILSARFLDRWRTGTIQPPAWALPLGFTCLLLLGTGAAVALLTVGGVLHVPKLHLQPLNGLGNWAAAGLLLIVGAAGAWWVARRERRSRSILVLAVMAVCFIGTLAAWGSTALDAYKAPRALVQWAQAQQTDREIRVGCYEYFQPSLVFYCRREVRRLETESEALEFLRCAVPVYVFMPTSVWGGLETKVRGAHRVLAQHYDLYRQCEVVVVTNR